MKGILAGEWIKFASLRSGWWTLAMLAALPVGVAVLVAATGSLAPEDTVLSGALGNAVVGLVPAGILGALMVASEYSGGTIRLTLAAVPLRWPVVVAKAVLAAALVLPVALASHAVGLALAVAALPAHRPGEPVPALLGVALVYAFVAVLGVALGAAIRSPAGAVTAVTGILLAPAFLAPLLTRVPWLAAVTPFGAAQRVLLPVPPPEGPDGWAGVTVVALGCLASLAAAAGLLLRRDA